MQEEQSIGQKDKTQQSEKEKRSSDSPSGKVVPMDKIRNRSITAEKKDMGSRVKTTLKKPGSSGTTPRLVSGSGDNKDSKYK